MFPCQTTDNTSDVTPCDAKRTGDCADFFAGCKPSPDLDDFINSLFGVIMLLAAVVPFLFDTVADVIELCSDKKMRNANASWCVATMENEKTVSNRSVFYLPREARSDNWTTRRSRHSVRHELSVSVLETSRP